MIYQITRAQFLELSGCPASDCAHFLPWTKEILVAIYKDKPLCFVGLMPDTLISRRAYVWMTMTDTTHGLVIARASRDALSVILNHYEEIYGHCFNALSGKWLRYLGAEFTSLTQFRIRRGQWQTQ